MKLAKQDLGKVAITVDKNYWNTTKAYDRLVIVEVMGVGSYISRKPVPAGIQYDNREYWIKVGSNGQGGAPTNVVTEFGDSVIIAIAQKTITDKFISVDSTIESIQRLLNTTISGAIANINTTLGSLSDTVTAQGEQLGTIQEDILDHLSKIGRIRTDLNAAVENIGLVKGQVDELNNSLVSISNSVSKIASSCWQSEVRTKPVIYFGSRVTEQVDDASMMYKLNRELGIQDNGNIIKETFLNSARLRYIIDHPEDFGDGLDIWINDIIIIQLGSDAEVTGSFDGTEILDIDDPTDYPDTFCGNMAYFLDKLNIKAREENGSKPKVFIIAPPKNNNTEMLNALATMQTHMEFVLINPFTARYDDECIKTITLEGETKIVLKNEYVDYWSLYVARAIKTNC